MFHVEHCGRRTEDKRQNPEDRVRQAEYCERQRLGLSSDVWPPTSTLCLLDSVYDGLFLDTVHQMSIMYWTMSRTPVCCCPSTWSRQWRGLKKQGDIKDGLNVHDVGRGCPDCPGHLSMIFDREACRYPGHTHGTYFVELRSRPFEAILWESLRGAERRSNLWKKYEIASLPSVARNDTS